MSVQTTPQRYRYSVIPHVMVDGAAAAIEFYERALGATEVFRISAPNGAIIHAEIQIGSAIVMLGDAGDGFGDPRAMGATSVGLHVYLDDVDAAFERAVAAGARRLQGVEDMFYGDRVAMIEDPFGHVWVLLEHREDLTPEEIERRAAEMFAASTS